MTVEWNKLADLAKEAQANAYAPYSRFRVGCALVSDTGNVYSGCNVENASYPVTMCAERGAISAAVVNGDKSFTQLMLITDADTPESPCGACRQVLQEFAPDLEIVSIGKNGTEQRWTMAELLPAPFDFKPPVGA